MAAARQSILSTWVAVDPVSVAVLGQIQRAATNRASLLISGEPGTGRDFIGSLIHYLGPHADGPLVRLDCASIPASLVENELFGSETVVGAGVVHITRGRLDMNSPGTIILQEVAALELRVQERLLKGLEQGYLQRTGGTRQVPMNARVIALTTADLQRAVSRRSFREDLFFHLATSGIVVPPLRQRGGDIPKLASHFLQRLCQLHRRPAMAFTPAALAALTSYAWPGNVRELRNLIEQLVLTATSSAIGPEDLPRSIFEPAQHSTDHKMSLQEMERAYIAEVLNHTKGRKSAAAGILGISRKTLLEKRKRYGLQ